MISDIHAIGLTERSIAYAWRQLLLRAGVQRHSDYNNLHLSTHYGPPDQPVGGMPGIIVVPAAPQAWQRLVTLPNESLDWVPKKTALPDGASLTLEGLIPVLFWAEGSEDGSKPFAARREDGSIVFYADILTSTFFMLSRWEETVVPARDQHDRFPATASVAYRQGFLDRPIVDEYALILQQWLNVIRPNWQPENNSFSVRVSHDIDEIRHASLRRLGGDMVKRRDVRRARQTAQALLSPKDDPYLQGISTLTEISNQCGLTSAFYWMAAQPSEFEVGYDPASAMVRSQIENVQRQGHEVGFHPSYYTLDDDELFSTEKVRLESILGNGHYGGRQHYLRFRVPHTWHKWDDAGLAYDSTLGYAAYEGFRCGTCHAYRPFDFEQDRELDLLERPLIVMDVTLRDYRRLSPSKSEERIMLLAKRCQMVAGTFTLLWHNTSIEDDWKPWSNMYRNVMPKLAAMQSHSNHRPAR